MNMDLQMIKNNPMCLHNIIHTRETKDHEEIEHTCYQLSEHIYHKIIKYILHIPPHHSYHNFKICIRVPMRIYNSFKHHTNHGTFMLLTRHTNERLYPYQIYMKKIVHLIDPVCIDDLFCRIPSCIQYIKTSLNLSCHMYFRISISPRIR